MARVAWVTLGLPSSRTNIKTIIIKLTDFHGGGSSLGLDGPPDAEVRTVAPRVVTGAQGPWLEVLEGTESSTCDDMVV